MIPVIETKNLSKSYRGGVIACDDVSLTVSEGTITGLLGRNGAGKTTLMQVITGQLFPSHGEVRLFGEPAIENASVLSRTCFIQEGQRFPESMTPAVLLRVAAGLYPRWDQAFADELIADFRLPLDRAIAKKLSRGQLSALGIVIGLASRAELTMLDEPYLGLDAVARKLFYDRLLADYAEHPRTILMSTHHIDEAADLLENVIVLDAGRVIVDESADDLRGSAVEVSGRAEQVNRAATGLRVLRRRDMGSLTTASVLLRAESDLVRFEGLNARPLSLQDLIVDMTAGAEPAAQRS